VGAIYPDRLPFGSTRGDVDAATQFGAVARDGREPVEDDPAVDDGGRRRRSSAALRPSAPVRSDAFCTRAGTGR
jgi:hypothetical protein